MSDFLKVNVDIQPIKGLENLERAMKEVSEQASKQLSAIAHAKTLELADQRLKTRKEKFLDNLSIHEEDGVWVIELKKDAVWIDTGFDSHSMLDSLLSGPNAKTSKDGVKYAVVPFNHSDKKNDTKAQSDLVSTVKTALKEKGIDLTKIEKHPDGRPKLGKLHSIDIKDKPIKKAEGPGQGKGPIGKVKQGKTGIPLLANVSVYQNAVNGDSNNVKRSVMTFRTATENGGGWVHPGLKATNILDDAFKAAVENLDTEVMPNIISKIISKL